MTAKKLPNSKVVVDTVIDTVTVSAAHLLFDLLEELSQHIAAFLSPPDKERIAAKVAAVKETLPADPVVATED